MDSPAHQENTASIYPGKGNHILLLAIRKKPHDLQCVLDLYDPTLTHSL